MSEYKAGASPLEDWKKEYRWTRDATRPTPDEIAAGKSDFKTTWRLFCKLDRKGAWLERRAIRAEAQVAQLQAERDELARKLSEMGYKPRCTCTMDDNMHEPQCAITEWARINFERADPVDWRGYEADETPLGIALDGGGDEVQE